MINASHRPCIVLGRYIRDIKIVNYRTILLNSESCFVTRTIDSTNRLPAEHALAVLVVGNFSVIVLVESRRSDPLRPLLQDDVPDQIPPEFVISMFIPPIVVEVMPVHGPEDVIGTTELPPPIQRPVDRISSMALFRFDQNLTYAPIVHISVTVQSHPFIAPDPKRSRRRTNHPIRLEDQLTGAFP